MGNNISVKEKVEFKRGQNVFEEVKKFYYLGDMFNSYGRVSEEVRERIGSRNYVGSWLYQYLSCVRPVLLYYNETWELTFADKSRLQGEVTYFSALFGVRLVDVFSSDAHRERVVVHSRLRWYGHVIYQDTNLQIL